MQNDETDALLFLNTLYKFIGCQYPKYFKMDKLCKLGFLASELLIENNDEIKRHSPHQVAVVLMNKNGSIDNDAKYYETTKSFASPSLFVYTLPNIVVGEICIRHQFKGENSFFISDELDGDFMQQYVNLLFEKSDTQACICGWVDILDNSYKASLFKIEKNKTDQSIDFLKQHLLN